MESTAGEIHGTVWERESGWPSSNCLGKFEKVDTYMPVEKQQEASQILPHAWKKPQDRERPDASESRREMSETQWKSFRERT